MKTYLKLLSILAVATLAFGCGGDDPDEPDNVLSAPTVVSVSPENGATEIATGTVNISVTYDQNIFFTSSMASQIQISGGTISSAHATGAVLNIVADCPNEGTRVSITIPAGLVKGPTQVPAEAYSFSFTTKEAYVPSTGNIATAPLTTNAAAVKLYQYFYQQYGQKVVSSVMADVNWNNKIAEKVHTLTGKYPAMNCYDFIHIYVPQNNWINYDDITPVKQWADAGGIVQLMWHFNVPKNETTTPGSDGSGVTCTPSETTFKAANALVSGTWENKWFYQEMDKVVAVIKKLQAEGIAATWRPFHEAAGNATARQQASWTKAWFWWGYDGAATYKQLWQTMYNYFKQQGVDNLIWIWTTQNYNGNSSQYNQDTDWYPGDNYVDMVARDLYGFTAAQNLQEFSEIQATYPNKMVVLGECGKGDSGEQGRMSDCWTQGAHWGHFMVWYQGGQGSTDTMCSDAWWRDAMSNANVITRDQLPNLK